MNDDLTLEKLRIHERLSSMEAKQEERDKHLVALLDRHNLAIFGDSNGKRGLDKRVDRIEQRNKIVNAFLTINIGLVCKIAWDWLTNKNG